MKMSRNVVEPKFACPMHREVKQTKTECGGQKGLLQGPSKENRWQMLKRPELPAVGFREEGFI